MPDFEIDDSPDALRDAMAARMGKTDDAPDDPELDDAADSDESPEPVPESGVDGGAGVSGAEPPVEDPDAEPPAESPSPEAPEAPAPPTEPDFIEIAGRRYPRGQEDALGQLIDWATEQIMQAPQPSARGAGAVGVGEAPAAPEQPAPPAAPTAPPFDPEQYVDPDLARAIDERFKATIDPLAARLDEIAEFERQRAAIDAQQRQVAIEAAATNALDSFATAHSLTPEEKSRLEQATVQSGFVQVYGQQTQNLDEVFTRSLEATYWITPEFRDRAVASQASAAATAATQAAQAQAAAASRDSKKSRAGGLAGGSSTVTRALAPPATKADRRAGMVDRITEIMAEP